MECFATAPLDWTAEQLREAITGPRLAECRDAIDRVLGWDAELDTGETDCLWGQFHVRRELIRDGVRFTLPGCPNALARTVTAELEGVLVHCTINRREHEPDFIASIEMFVEDWRSGLGRLWNGSDALIGAPIESVPPALADPAGFPADMIWIIGDHYAEPFDASLG